MLTEIAGRVLDGDLVEEGMGGFDPPRTHGTVLFWGQRGLKRRRVAGLM
jgi:hypothetical protein